MKGEGVIDKEVFEVWTSSPLVQRAIARAGEGAETVDVLETLHGMMLDLEERAPGVPFIELFEGARTAVSDEGHHVHLGLGSTEARQALGRAAAEAGISSWELDTIFGDRQSWGPGRTGAEAQAKSHPALGLFLAGKSYREIADELGIGISRVSQVVCRARERGYIK